jgi:hypothetical protein
MSTAENLLCKFVPTPESKPEPKLRHEFVGMMFAVTIGEVGLQVADLIRAGDWVRHLPAYSHLLLAALLITTSWVGWTLSFAPGARRDVEGIFQWEFLVLLLDVAGVIIYFILVRAVDAPALTIASWIVAVFWAYFLWDVLTKVIIYWKYREKDPPKKWYQYYGSTWGNDFGLRMLPTFLCLMVAWVIRGRVGSADITHRITADFALLSLVLFFRALKEVVSVFFPASKSTQAEREKLKARKNWALLWTTGWAIFLVLGVLWTNYSWSLPLSKRIIHEIETEYSNTNRHSEAPPTGRYEQSHTDEKR